MTDFGGGVPGGAGAPPAPQAGVKQWAQNEFAPPEQRAEYLQHGEVDGTAKHEFPVTDRAFYLSQIKGTNIAAKSLQAPIALVRLDQLQAIQNTINRERLGQHLANPKMNAEGTRAPGHGMLIDRPVVVKVGGTFYIHDGHHRLTAQALRGLSTAKVRLIDLDAENPDFVP
jgi:hypothetical protein